MIKQFKEFALKGNVLDIGVGIIIGAAFGRVVSSFVSDLLTPPLGLVLGRVDFSSLFITLSAGDYASLAEAQAAGAATLNYGLFLNNVLDFMLVAFALFFIIRWVNRLRPTPAVVAAPVVKQCPECLSNIPSEARRCAHCTSVVGSQE